MIPRLLKSDATDFTKLGYGPLLKTTECKVTESLTDSPTLEMLLLDDDELTRYLEVGSIITAEPNKRDVAQAFVVEEITKPIDGVISIYATHIAQYRAKLIPVSTFTASTLDNALTAVVSNSMETNPFTLVRDSGKNNVTATMTTTVPHSLRELMGGMEGSILDIYRGEWGYDNFTLTLYNKRGRDNGVQVMYSRNMTDFSLDEIFDWDSSVTGVIGYWKSEDGATTVISDIQYSSNATAYPYKKTICMDFTDRFESQPTKAQLDTYCSNWISSRGLIGATVDVAFDHLDIQNGEDIGLGDTVHIYNARYNLDMESRIIGTVYDVLRDEFETITIGDMKTTLSEAIQETVGDTGGMSSGSVEPSSTTPAMDGVANVGSEGKFARGDHVHPSDTSRFAKAGDDLSGNVRVLDSNIDATAAAPASVQTAPAFQWTDKNLTTISTFRLRRLTSANNGAIIQSIIVNKSGITNQLDIGVDDNNTRYVNVTAPTQWRTALELNGGYLIIGVQNVSCTASSVAAGASASCSGTRTNVSGASGYWYIPRYCNYGYVSGAPSVSGTTISVNATNATSASHNLTVSVMVIAYKTL